MKIADEKTTPDYVCDTDEVIQVSSTPVNPQEPAFNLEIALHFNFRKIAWELLKETKFLIHPPTIGSQTSNIVEFLNEYITAYNYAKTNFTRRYYVTECGLLIPDEHIRGLPHKTGHYYPENDTNSLNHLLNWSLEKKLDSHMESKAPQLYIDKNAYNLRAMGGYLYLEQIREEFCIANPDKIYLIHTNLEEVEEKKRKDKEQGPTILIKEGSLDRKRYADGEKPEEIEKISRDDPTTDL